MFSDRLKFRGVGKLEPLARRHWWRHRLVWVRTSCRGPRDSQLFEQEDRRPSGL